MTQYAIVQVELDGEMVTGLTCLYMGELDRVIEMQRAFQIAGDTETLILPCTQGGEGFVLSMDEDE